MTASTAAESNIASEIDTNSASFSADVGIGRLYLKAFLNSNSSQNCSLESLKVLTQREEELDEEKFKETETPIVPR